MCAFPGSYIYIYIMAQLSTAQGEKNLNVIQLLKLEHFIVISGLRLDKFNLVSNCVLPSLVLLSQNPLPHTFSMYPLHKLVLFQTASVSDLLSQMEI